MESKDEFVFELLKTRYKTELQRINDPDGKAGSIFGYVTIVTGLMVGLGNYQRLRIIE